MSGFVWGQVWITRGIVKWCSVHHARDPVKKSGGAAIPVRCATERGTGGKMGEGPRQSHHNLLIRANLQLSGIWCLFKIAQFEIEGWLPLGLIG